MNFINKSEPRFTMVPKGAVHDRSLSFSALGLLVMFLECPYGTDVSSETLQERGGLTGAEFETILQQLRQAGYVGPGPSALVRLEGE